MEAKYILFNMVAALGLFFLNGLLGKLQYGISEPLFEYGKFTFSSREDHSFSGNFFQKIVNPAVYLAALAALTQSLLPAELMESFWLLIPIFWGYRLLYMLLKNTLIFLNLKYEAFAFVLSLLLGEGVFFCIIRPLLSQGESIWISAAELRDALWFAILAYIAKVSWDIMKQLFSADNLYPNERRSALVVKRYDKFAAKYGSYIAEKAACRVGDTLAPEDQEELIRLVYAIMIYEDYNRPFMIRALERFIKAIFRKHQVMTLGIMQVSTREMITDRESIGLAIEKISGPFLDRASVPVDAALSLYNQSPDYSNEVLAIYRILDANRPAYDASIDTEDCKI